MQMITRLSPLSSGRDTEIDMIEREMEGGVVIIQPPDIDEHYLDERLGGIVAIEEHVQVRELGSKRREAPKA
jgi:hypothetical protein